MERGNKRQPVEQGSAMKRRAQGDQVFDSLSRPSYHSLQLPVVHQVFDLCHRGNKWPPTHRCQIDWLLLIFSSSVFDIKIN